MKDYINIYLGKLANDADDAAKDAYVKNAASKIGAAVGWTASGDRITSPSGNERFVFSIYGDSTLGIGCAIYTRSSSDADWVGWKWTVGYYTQWGVSNISAGAYATLVKSATGGSWALVLSNSANNANAQVGVFQNADKRFWIHSMTTNNIFNLADGIKYTGNTAAGIMDWAVWNVLTSAEKTTIIPAPDPQRGSYFLDVARLVSTTGTSYSCGNIFFANGKYYRYIGHGFLICVA